jgi:hypothetical protein
MAIQTQIKKVLIERDLPFCKVLYSGENFIAISSWTSSSPRRQNTGKLLKMVV